MYNLQSKPLFGVIEKIEVLGFCVHPWIIILLAVGVLHFDAAVSFRSPFVGCNQVTYVVRPSHNAVVLTQPY
eukprot:scaffold42134_cov252-Amphora_coffeaeformis.AAC.2